VYIVMKIDYDESESAAAYFARDNSSRLNSTSVRDLPEKRSWFVGRILSVCKLLRKESLIRVHETLLGYLEPLSLASSGLLECVDKQLGYWREIRQEILDQVSLRTSARGSPIS
jgi:hypothetical protein